MHLVVEMTIFFVYLVDDWTVESISDTEYSFLVDFYHSTNGKYWNDNSGWQFINMSNNSESIQNICINYTLFGLSCQYSKTDNMYHISSIEFINNGLQGSIPHSINNLSYLEIFEIEYEYNLTNMLPQSIFDLEYLWAIVIYETSMIIEMTNKVCQLYNLQYYESMFNQYIYGKIPHCIKNLTQLKYFFIVCKSLSRQNIVGNLSIAGMFGNLTNLLSLSIYHTDLVIDISRNTGMNNESLTWCNLRKLQTFAIFDNKYTYGKIPDCVANLTESQWFVIHSNDLASQNIYGTLPNGLFNLSNLEELNIAHTNTFNSVLPSIINFPNISTFQLLQVGLVGTIPNTICNIATNNMGDFLDFNLGANQLYGTIPTCL